jgi:geranylgeranyl pyrophosphate synthase
VTGERERGRGEGRETSPKELRRGVKSLSLSISVSPSLLSSTLSSVAEEKYREMVLDKTGGLFRLAVGLNFLSQHISVMISKGPRTHFNDL